MAGGLGTRLQSVVKEVPKVMAPVNNRPFLEYLLDYLEQHHIKHVILSVGYKNDIISNHFQHKYKSIELEYCIENTPLGTGGGIKKAFSMVINNNAVVLNGDTLFKVNLCKAIDFHKRKESQFSIMLRQAEEIQRYGSVECNTNNRITKFNEKGDNLGLGQINGGIYIINKEFFTSHHFPEKFSIEKDCFEKMVDHFPFYGLLCNNYFIDIGIPDDYQKAQDDFKEPGN